MFYDSTFHLNSFIGEQTIINSKFTLQTPVMKHLILLLILSLSLNVFSNNDTISSHWSLFNFKVKNKGKLYFYWGYNRGAYTNSDISFKGDGFDFTINNVKAHDRQTPFGWAAYFLPENLTIPQTNTKFGYFINDHLSINFGVDHMKYVTKQFQSLSITGEINTGGEYDRMYDKDEVEMTREFLKFEHTDGLNYLNSEINYWHSLIAWKEKIILQGLGGAGAGFMMPKTNSTLLGLDRYDDFQIAGYGLNIKYGLNLRFCDYFFIQSEVKGGFIHMPNIQPTMRKSDKASQHFFFGEYTFLFGFNMPLLKEKKKFQLTGTPSF